MGQKTSKRQPNLPKLTKGELVKFLEKYPDDTPVSMCMDWTELNEVPPHLDQQWSDSLGEVAFDDKKVILLNSHFR